MNKKARTEEHAKPSHTSHKLVQTASADSARKSTIENRNKRSASHTHFDRETGWQFVFEKFF